MDERVDVDPLRKALTHGLALWSILVPLWILVAAALHHTFALDFHGAFMPAARAVRDGVSPYSRIGSLEIRENRAYLYPPLTAYLLFPFTLLPAFAASVLGTVLAVAAVPATLLLLGVRDWRCHAIAFLWVPVIVGVQTANVTLPMLVGLGLCWRYRDRWLIAGASLALVVAMKLFFWPALVWLIATRRFRAAGLAAAGSLVLVMLPWAGIAFSGLHSYPHLLATVSRIEGPHSYSVAALIHELLPSWTSAVAVETAIGAIVLFFVLRSGQQRRDREAFALAVAAILVLTPLLQMSYLALLLVIVALYCPVLSPAWFVPLFIWGASGNGPGGSAWQVGHVLVVATAMVVVAMHRWHPRLTRQAPQLGSRFRVTLQ